MSTPLDTTNVDLPYEIASLAAQLEAGDRAALATLTAAGAIPERYVVSVETMERVALALRPTGYYVGRAVALLEAAHEKVAALGGRAPMRGFE